MWPSMMTEAPMAFFELLELLALLVGKTARDLMVRLSHDLADAPASIVSHLLELFGRFIDDRRNPGDLFRRQIKLRAKLFLHSMADQARMMVKFKEEMPDIQSSQGGASDSASDKYQEETGHKLPFQRFVHWENSS
jgi:hypothetical protein